MAPRHLMAALAATVIALTGLTGCAQAGSPASGPPVSGSPASGPPVAVQAGLPTLYANQWTVIVVPAGETAMPSQPGGALTVAGLTHSLRLGQLLATVTSGPEARVRGLYSITGAHGDSSVAPLQTLQPFALLRNAGVRVMSVKAKAESGHGSAEEWTRALIGNRPAGVYVVAASASAFGPLTRALGGTALTATPGQYAVFSGQALPLAAAVYSDGIPADPVYPTPALPRPVACPPAQTITAKAPPGLTPVPDQKVVMVRHAEAHPTRSFENGNYVCQGQWRALGVPPRLDALLGKTPDAIFTTNPDNLTDCDETCSYIRPLLTVAPYATRMQMPLTLASFNYTDYADLAAALFDGASRIYPHAAGQTILVGWEHGNLAKAVKYLFATLYQSKQKVPDWAFDDYDTVWTLQTDADGTLTLTTGCEEIPSASLPSVCPAVFQQ